MSLFTHPEFDNHEQVVFCHDKKAGLKAIISIHNLNRGPALGGCRRWPYASEDEALTDVLRLSRGMTYKAALAELPFGGGKSVILAEDGQDPAALYDAMGRFVETLGGRYTDEQKSFTPDQIIYQNYYAGFSNLVPADNPLAALDAPFLQAGGRILPLLEKDIDISEFTPMANLAFDLSDDMMVYLSYSEGFKSGGFTQRVFPPIIAPFTAAPGTPDIDLIPTYDPEFVEVLELGFKGTFMDGRVRVNGALFTTDYEDLQVQVFNSVAPVTQNIGKASIEGLELEVMASPGNGWLVEASLSLLDANYDEIDTGNTLIARDNDFERVPETAASLGLSRELTLGDNGTLILRGDWSYRSKTFNDAYNTALLETDSTDLIDASVRWLSADEAWTVILSGINLTDEEYMVTGVYGTAFQSFEGLFDRGRELRLEVRRDF